MDTALQIVRDDVAWILYNTVLNTVPLALLLATERVRGASLTARIARFFLIATAVVFLPNAAYAMTHPLHWTSSLGNAGTTMPVVVIASVPFALYAAYSFVVWGICVRLLSDRLRKTHPGLVRPTLAALCVVSAVAIYVGRMERFNSWGLVTRPRLLLRAAEILVQLQWFWFGSAALVLLVAALTWAIDRIGVDASRASIRPWWCITVGIYGCFLAFSWLPSAVFDRFTRPDTYALASVGYAITLIVALTVGMRALRATPHPSSQPRRFGITLAALITISMIPTLAGVGTMWMVNGSGAPRLRLAQHPERAHAPEIPPSQRVVPLENR